MPYGLQIPFEGQLDPKTKLFSGRGRYLYRNEDFYEGEFVASKKHGSGTYRYTEKGESYTGFFSQDLRDGEGKYLEKNGNCYTGQWAKDLKHGEGKYHFNTGEIYQG